jgi:hypothetical protein
MDDAAGNLLIGEVKDGFLWRGVEIRVSKMIRCMEAYHALPLAEVAAVRFKDIHILHAFGYSGNNGSDPGVLFEISAATVAVGFLGVMGPIFLTLCLQFSNEEGNIRHVIVVGWWLRVVGTGGWVFGALAVGRRGPNVVCGDGWDKMGGLNRRGVITSSKLALQAVNLGGLA